ncbi:MAG TPA: DNA polymerase III subunit alpha [Methylomirabilota bacterium]|nr:DNA polymerase III subunit alpha [Methylomirabilota bacterium]
MYVELHAHSAFSFLEATPLPEQLAEHAARLEQPAIALLDRDGLYGAPRLYREATRLGLTALVGAEVTLHGGGRLPLLAEDQEGYRNLCRLLTRIKMRAAKGEGAATLEDLAEHAGGLVCLTGGADGPVTARLALDAEDARALIERLVGIFGRFNVYVELQRHLIREEEARNEWLRAQARSLHLPLLATNEPRLIGREDRLLLDVLTCVREHITLDQAGRRLCRNSERFMKSGQLMERLFVDCPEAVANTGELALRLGFTLKNLGYQFPEYPLPPGQTPTGFLRALSERGARQRYGTGPLAERAKKQIERELDLIGRLDLAGYFLIVWDLVQYCGRNDILVQGRGSAANSAVCYALGITAVDPVGMELLFERFLSEERGEWPDIDLDLPSGDRREKVIQYVYERYGKLGGAMTANVITYRGRSAAREVGKALALPADLIERLAQLVSDWEYKDPGDTLLAHLDEAGCDPGETRIQHFARIWAAVQDLPRHLGQHSGGMVICQGRLDSVVPLEPATMPGRSVVQWDKDDCAALGIVKVDLLGLGMMALLQDALEMIHRRGGQVDLAHLPPDDPKVYAALQQADTIGVFQVESRAQMATLPRLRPERFYDLVVQVAIIRPGPIVGDMVHPYLRRRAGREPVTVPHPALEPILARTLGVPLFQEQLLRMAMATAGFTGGEAEELRRAFGFKRSERAMKAVEEKLLAGMARQGITGETAETIISSITAFALYGFPECVVGDTRVIDADTGRWVKVEDIVNRSARVEHTLACDVNKRLVKRRILDATSSGCRMVYRLRTALGRELMATAEHPLLTMDGWRALASLEVGDHIAAPRLLPGLGRKRWPRHQLIDSSSLARLAESDVYWDRIIAIEPAGERETYDLQIEEDHNFIANDLVVHNSHAASFALLAYASAYIKTHHSAAFYAALLNNQPMGFYHPATVVRDAQRHGQVIHPADVNFSGWLCTIEPDGAVRLGLRYVRGLREEVGKRIEEERRRRPFTAVRELVERTRLRRDELAQLARVGALGSLEPERRAALWEAGRAGRPSGPLYEALPDPPERSPLRPMTPPELVAADYEGTGLSVGPHPMEFYRAQLRPMQAVRAADLAHMSHGATVRVAGAVVVRQRPGTAKGFVFLNLEDETGLINVIVRPALFHRHRLALVNEPFLFVEGTLQHQDNVISVRAERIAPLLRTSAAVPSHDFH